MLLNIEQQKQLRQLLNAGAKVAGESLKTMLDSNVSLSIPVISAASSPTDNTLGLEKALADIGMLYFSGDISGRAFLLILQDKADEMTTLLTGEAPDDAQFHETKKAMVSEVANIIVNGIIGSMSNQLQKNIDFSPPHFSSESPEVVYQQQGISAEELALLANIEFNVEEHNLEGKIIVVFDHQSFKSLMDAVDELSLEMI